MVKPALLYLHKKDETPPRLEHWPELGRIELAESEESFSLNFCMGGPFETYCQVISIEVNDRDGLEYINLLKGFHVIALRGNSFSGEWGNRLQEVADSKSAVISLFTRHDVAAALGRKAYWDGIELLQIAAGYLRGPAVDPSPAAMKTETVLSRAIESLCTTGYKTPKR